MTDIIKPIRPNKITNLSERISLFIMDELVIPCTPDLTIEDASEISQEIIQAVSEMLVDIDDHFCK
jgi:hypothetical protein